MPSVGRNCGRNVIYSAELLQVRFRRKTAGDAKLRTCCDTRTFHADSIPIREHRWQRAGSGADSCGRMRASYVARIVGWQALGSRAHGNPVRERHGRHERKTGGLLSILCGYPRIPTTCVVAQEVTAAANDVSRLVWVFSVVPIAAVRLGRPRIGCWNGEHKLRCANWFGSGWAACRKVSQDGADGAANGVRKRLTGGG